ncbi:MAG: hypothetical protein RLZZ182_139 [Pseudomonadota bacterium]
MTAVRHVKAWAAGVGCALMALSGAAQAATLCVFDLVGTTGDAFNASKDYVLAMQRENVTLDLRAFPSEARAVEEFKAGRCDALFATGMRVRQFNTVSGSIDTYGATTIVRNGRLDINAGYEVLRKLLQIYAADSPQAQALMTQGRYEVGGVAPIGAAYLMAKDRRINSVEAMKGKRIMSLEYDPAQSFMVRRIEAVPVLTDINTVMSAFRDNRIDIIALPALAFRPLRVEDTLGPNGVIGRFPLMMLTYQVILDRSKFPEGFGQKSRTWWVSQYDRALQLIRKAETLDVSASLWLDPSPEATYRYNLMVQEGRIDMARQGIYDKRALRIMKKVRCHVNPTDNECKTRQEEDWN